MSVYVCLTHDVDTIFRSAREVFARRSRFSRADILKHLFRVSNLYNNIYRICEVEDAYKLRSTFFIPVNLFPIEKMLDEIKYLRDGGWEVGFHSVIENIQPFSIVKMSLEFLEEEFSLKVYGVRAHYLRVNNDIIRMYSKLGLIYDSSYRVESLDSKGFLKLPEGLWELPIAIMDTDVFGRLMLSEKSAWKYITAKIEKLVKSGYKVITILFHQESFRMKGGRLYSRLIDWLWEKEYTMGSCYNYLKAEDLI